MSEKQSIDAEALHGKTVALTAMYLKRRGFEVVGSGLRRNGFPFDIVARDGKETAFVEVAVGDRWDAFLERDEGSAREMREAAAGYAKENGLADVPRGGMRIDLAHIKLVGEDNAFLRYHEDAYGSVLGERSRRG